MNDTLKQMRIMAKMTQEELAEKMNVSRQSVAKWESGDSVPDIIKCSELAKIFNVEIEDIANIFINKTEMHFIHPKNKFFFGICKVFDNKIRLPDDAMAVFHIQNGDELLVFGDTTQGLAMVPKDSYNELFSQVMNAPVYGGDDNNENSH